MLNHIRFILLVTIVLLVVQVPGAFGEGLRGPKAASPDPDPTDMTASLTSETDSYAKVVLEPQRKLGRCTGLPWWLCGGHPPMTNPPIGPVPPPFVGP
jgi:hypothetical protein